jgi:hypothetical protein
MGIFKSPTMNDKKKVDNLIGPILQWAKENQERTKTREQAKSLRMLAKKPEPCEKEEKDDLQFLVPPEFTGKDYVSMLISIDAEIEHGLMLQYLYGAYSLGGPQVPDAYKEKVRNWQNIILGIAKEEMGHFISVQNVLKVMGASLNFGRESYPWDSQFYPFPFTLERFTLKSLAKYIYAEAPSEWLNPDCTGKLTKEQQRDCEESKEIKALVKAADVDQPHNVGALFKVIIGLIKDREVVPDEVFQANTYPFQAKFDEWGRGYAGGSSDRSYEEKIKGKPDVLVVPLSTRDDAVSALEEIAEQGEGEEIKSDNTSHFERFLFVYREMKEVLKEADGKWHPSRNVATNPYVSGTVDPDENSADGTVSNESNDPIYQEEAKMWANLFNVRYRLLLNFLNHSFLLDGGLNDAGTKTARGMIINSTFGEMYNLRSIAMVLVRTPISNRKNETLMAGPPFTIPYTLDLPFGEHNRWRVHQDLLEASRKIVEELRPMTAESNLKYLNALEELDRSLLRDIAQLTEYAS